MKCLNKEFKFKLVASFVNYVTECITYIYNLCYIANFLATSLALKCICCIKTDNIDTIVANQKKLFNVLTKCIKEKSEQILQFPINNEMINKIFQDINNDKDINNHNDINNDDIKMDTFFESNLNDDINKHILSNLDLDDLPNLSKDSISKQCSKIILDYLNNK